MTTRRARSRMQAAMVLPALLAVVTLSLGARRVRTLAARGKAHAPQSTASGPRIWLAEPQSVTVRHVGAGSTATQNAAGGGAATNGAQIGANTTLAATVETNGAAALNDAAARNLAAGQGQPLAMAKGDFDQDGVEDLIVGYATPNGGAIALHRGNLDAFAPQSQASFDAIGRGNFPQPFLPDVQVFSIPVRPDFLAAGNFTGSGSLDIVAAARGGNAIYLFAGDGRGNFGQPQIFNLSGAVNALAAGILGSGQSLTNIVAGISNSPKSFSLVVLGGTPLGLGPLASYPLSAPASNIDFGTFGGPGQDAVFLSGGKVTLLHSSSMQLEQVSLPVSASALALGSFIYDRNRQLQIAVLGADGSINIAAHSEFDPHAYSIEEVQAKLHSGPRGWGRPDSPAQSSTVSMSGWKIVETFPSVASVAPGQAPAFFRTRISDNGADDIMWLNASAGQMVVLSHPDEQPGATTFLPGLISFRPYSGLPVAALPMRTNVDARPGIMAIHQGQIAPSMVMPIPDPTFTVNTTNDTLSAGACLAATPGQCSLREAIIEANATPGTDTIMVPAGTYTLTRPRAATPQYDATTGTLNINDSVNIVGAGQNTTIIQAGTIAYNAGTPNGVDMVMAVNEDIISASVPAFTNATASISGLTIQNGHNRGVAGQDGDGGCMEFDTGGSGTATLTLTNVTLRNCDTTAGNGGGLASFNFTHPLANSGMVTITNSIIQGNKAVQSTSGVAGGFWSSLGSDPLQTPARFDMTTSQVLNNQAGSAGGGIYQGGPFITSGQTRSHISTSTISGNTAAGLGGGIYATGGLVIDQGTIISNNSGGTGNQVNAQEGGGIFFNIGANPTPDTADLTHLTITGNSATGSGGGIRVDDAGGNINISFSRITNNTAGVSGSNLSNRHDVNPDPGSKVTAQNNWWGTNTPGTTIDSSTSTCPAGVHQVCFDPWIVLTHSASPNPIRINQSTTLTGDMSNDNHGNGAALSGNLGQIAGLPITFDNPVLGTIPQAQPETLGNPVPTATATFNAGGTSGRGSAHATVDQGVVSANSNLIASATEAATTVTITTVGKHNFAAGETAVISGVGVGGYNGTFTITGTPTATTFTYATTAGLGASSGGTANVGIIILEPLQITKSFNPATVAVNASSALTFNVTNPNVIGVDASFTDTLPASLVVAATPGVTNTCGGSVTAVAGAGSVSFSNATLPVGACTITVNVSSAIDNIYSNSVTINSTAAGTGAQSTSSANLTVINPPTIVKAFGASTIPLNGTTSLMFTLSSTNANLTLTGVAFTDNLPAGLVVASPNGLTSTCGGTATAVAGSGSVSLLGASFAPGASCTISLNVQGTTAGVKNNSAQVISTNGGTGNTTNAQITVVGPPVIIKAFGAASIPLNNSTSLSFTIQNNNSTTTLNGIGFSDTLPAGLVVSAPNGLSGSCGGGTITATQATNVISLTGASLAQSTSCTFSVNVTGTAAGTQNNTTGNVTSTEGGTGGTASASINVVAPPSIAKAFNPTTIALNANSTLTFTITNPAANTVAETGVAFTDTLPAGLVVATPNGLSNTCGGTATAVAGSTSISLTGGSIAVNTSCTVVVNITGTTSGQYTNTSGAVSSTNGGTGNTASANLTVAVPPTITKAFGAASIPLNGPTSLTFTIQNPNTGVTLNGVAFTDNLPAGLVVASPNGLANSCGGTATAVAGAGSLSLSGGTLAASASCTMSVNVQGTTAGVKNNSVQVTSTEGGTGNTSNAQITVVAPPVIIKAFGAASIPLNGSTSLTFTIQNNNTTTTLNGIGFSDTLPTGLVVSTPNGLTGSCGAGTITATQATNVISLSGATLAQSSSCTFSVNVTGTTAGTKNNTTGNVTSTEGGTGGTASASINVVGPPSIAKAFGAAGIPLNGTTSLTFTITNPAANAVAETGVAFTDALPAGIVVATPNGLTNTCGGTATAVAGSGSVSLTGGTVAANSTCAVTVNVTGTTSGNFVNTTGAVSSTNGGTGNTATANLAVATPPTITKAFGAAAIPLNGSTSLTFSITNPAANTIPLTGLAFTDNLPAGLVVATPNGLTNNCGGTATAVAGAGSVSLSAGTLAVNTSCTLSVNITGTTAGVKNNSTQVTSTEGGAGNTTNASITVVAPPVITKQFGTPPVASIPLNGTIDLDFSIQNNNASSLSGIGFTDTLPAGLIISSPNGLAGSCGAGTITATAGTNVISLSGGTLPGPAGTNCNFHLNVTGTTSGTKNNTTGNVTSTEGGTGGTASASISVVGPPSIAKAFNPTAIAVNGTSTLTITITNPAANAVAATGVAFTDNLPAGLVVATPNGLTNTCGGTATATAGSGSVSLTGGTIAASSSCTLTVNVTASAAATYTNTTGAVSSTNGGTGNTATATLTVQPADLTITKTHTPFTRGATGQVYTITVKNSGLGPTVGTVTVVDTPPAVPHPLVPTALSGTGWTCTLATLTCTRSDVLAPGASYPAISLTVNVPINIQNNFTNTATVSGGGETNTANDTANDPTSLGPPLNITPINGSAIVPVGGSVSFSFTVDVSANPPLGAITFACPGAPFGVNCAFNPASDTQVPTSTVTMTVTTTGNNSAALRPPAGGTHTAPLYAALVLPLPLLGLVGIFTGEGKNRKRKLRLGLLCVGLLAVLTFAGCRGATGVQGTPQGSFPLSVTATSSVDPTVNATTTVILTVR